MIALFTIADASVVTACLALLGVIYQSTRQAKQYKPNGGKTMRDAVDRIELRLAELTITGAKLSETVKSIDGRLSDVENTITAPPPSRKKVAS